MSDEQVKEQEQEAKPNPKEELTANLHLLLATFEGAPDQATLDAWKAKHKDIFVSGFSEAEVYIWRTITRPEYIKIQQEIQQPGAAIDQYKFEELVCEACVLWKSTKESWAEGKAGTPNVLAEQIMLNSNFLNPQHASLMVVKL